MRAPAPIAHLLLVACSTFLLADTLGAEGRVVRVTAATASRWPSPWSAG